MSYDGLTGVPNHFVLVTYIYLIWWHIQIFVYISLNSCVGHKQTYKHDGGSRRFWYLSLNVLCFSAAVVVGKELLPVYFLLSPDSIRPRRLHLAAQRGKCSFISVWYGVCQLWEKLCVSREGRNGLEFIWWCFFCYCLEEFKPGLPALLWPSGLFPRRRGLLRCIFRAFEVGGACCDAAGAASTLEMGHRDFSSLCVCVFGCGQAQIIFNRVYIGCVYI